MAISPEKAIVAAGFPAYLHGFSAIDSYLGRNSANAVHVLCGADLADLARLFEGIRYPGAAFADAAVDAGGRTWYFRCEEADSPSQACCALEYLRPRRHSFSFLEFYQDCKTSRFYDPIGIHPMLRNIGDIAQWWKTINFFVDPCCALFDAAVILARYFPETATREINLIAAELHGLDKTGPNKPPPPPMEEQRLLLTMLLAAANPAPGFELLKKCGFIAAHWPELAVLDDVDHSKEFHPEGNVWKHTLETLRYRKSPNASFDLRLSLGLLLHDVGKPLSESSGHHRFDGHAELGERQARRFLQRLGFEAPLAHDVCYLVRNHMLPAALPRLPLIRTGEVMASPLFPTLLELYRCDESSSFKGLDGYYRSSAAYQSFLKNRRNPYRSADGKKLRRAW
ncbi:MAG: HD domain-containing protein [Treponema sp.]|jgi:poly(A) polymerase|nr:HD domain-containing protein [Treponema sp.]